jgi:hypothetical protein
MTGATSALLIVIVLVGAAIAGHRHSPDVVATGPPPSSTPSTTTAVCTDADLTSRGLAPMPRAERVTKTELSTAAEIEPPTPGAHPFVTAESVWRRAKTALTPTTSYQLLLAVYTGPYPSATPQPHVNRVLTWVVVRRHFPVDTRAVSYPVPPGHGSLTRPPCYFGTRYDVFDARTGTHLASSVTS